MKRILIISLLLVVLSLGFAYEITFPTNYLSLNKNTGVLTITYNLSYDTGETVLPSHVYILASKCGVDEFTIFPTSVSGDLGYDIMPGNAKTIHWNMIADNIPKGESYKVKVVASNTDIITPVIGGVYEMGRTENTNWPHDPSHDRERPIHGVSLNDFQIGVYEVTQGDFEVLMGYNPAVKYGTTTFGDQPNHPAHSVNWFETIVYCNLRSMMENLTPVYTIDSSTNPADWGDIPNYIHRDQLSDPTAMAIMQKWNSVTANWEADGYRLPTEAEWEYAARGALYYKEHDYKYSGSGNVDEVAWYKGNNDVGNSTTKLVGLKQVNPIKLGDITVGVYDMSGNVSEWCWDWFDPYYYDEADLTQDENGNYINPQDNPKGPSEPVPENGLNKRVRRGGHFADDSSFSRVFDRDRQCVLPNVEQANTRHYVGFRVVRNN